MARRMKAKTRRKLMRYAQVSAMALVVAVLGTVAVVAIDTEQRPQRDDVTGCYNVEGMPQHVVALDASINSWTQGAAQDDLHAAFMGLYDRIPDGGGLHFVTTAPGQESFTGTPALTLCKGFSTNESRVLVGLDEVTPMMIANHVAADRERFDDALDGLFEGILSADQEASTSPIFEMLKGISGHDYGGTLAELVLFSDGVQNSGWRRFGVVQGHLPRHATALGQGDYWKIEPEPWDGAAVTFHFTGMDIAMRYARPDEIVQFIEDYFIHHGASTFRLRPLYRGEGQ